MRTGPFILWAMSGMERKGDRKLKYVKESIELQRRHHPIPPLYLTLKQIFFRLNSCATELCNRIRWYSPGQRSKSLINIRRIGLLEASA